MQRDTTALATQISTYLTLLGLPEVQHGGQRFALPANWRGQMLALLAECKTLGRALGADRGVVACSASFVRESSS